MYYANRSAAYQARVEWQQAEADARECLSLDVNYLKGYTFLIKAQLALSKVRSGGVAAV